MLLAYPAKFGAYTELFAGLHPDVTVEKSGMFSKCALSFQLSLF
jgi:hypothetical protein